MSEVTQILQSAQAGDPLAAEKLLPLVYDELRKLAAARLAQEQPGQTLQATALVHEAYLRLVGGPGGNNGGAVGNALRGVPGGRGQETGDSHESPNLSPVPCPLRPSTPAVISSPPRPRPCGGFWSNKPAGNTASNGAAAGSGSISTTWK